MKVILGKEQRSWIARNFFKLAQGQLDAEKKRILKRIADKCLQKDAIDFNKQEATIILQAVAVALMALTKVLEKYATDKKKYEEYIKKATDKKKELEALEDKIKRKLK